MVEGSYWCRVGRWVYSGAVEVTVDCADSSIIVVDSSNALVDEVWCC